MVSQRGSLTLERRPQPRDPDLDIGPQDEPGPVPQRPGTAPLDEPIPEPSPAQDPKPGEQNTEDSPGAPVPPS